MVKPERRTAFEQRNGVGLAPHVYSFGEGQYPAMIALNALGKGTIETLRPSIGGAEAGHDVLSFESFGRPNGSFDHGFLVFAAANREIIENDQRYLVDEVNLALEGLCSIYRLAPTINPEF